MAECVPGWGLDEILWDPMGMVSVDNLHAVVNVFFYSCLNGYFPERANRNTATPQQAAAFDGVLPPGPA